MKCVMDAAVEPAWLEQMLEESLWRLMLIELVDKHKTCGVLNHALPRISEADHHQEIASITNALAFFSVFTGVFQDALQRLPCDPRDE
jgi:negative elongation factor C/D